MDSLNKRIEAFKEEAQERTELLQERLISKSKDCELLLRERADLEVRIKTLTANVTSLKALTQSQREDISKDRETFETLEQANKELLSYKEAIAEKRQEVEDLTLRINKLDSDIKTQNIDLDNEKRLNETLKKELKETKDRLGTLETQKREYINNLGFSKLNLSSLNFSKFFGDNKDIAAGGQSPVFSPAMGKTTEAKRKVSDSFESKEAPILESPPIKKKIETPKIQILAPQQVPPKDQKSTDEKKEIDFLGRHETPRFFFDEPPNTTSPADNPYFDDSEKKVPAPVLNTFNLGATANGNPYVSLHDNPYVSRMSSVKPMQQGSVLKVRESRVTSMLHQIGGMRDEFNLMQDYIGIGSIDKVAEELQKFGDTTLSATKCYSDSIFLFDKSFKKSRFICVVTSHSVSFFNMRKSKLIKLFFLKSLKGITISSENYTLMVMHFEKQPDLLLESYRRLELIGYINQMIHINKLPKFSLTVRKRFIIKTDIKQQVPDQIELADPNLKVGTPAALQETLRNAKKGGFLFKQIKNWYGSKTQTEYFCMLSNLGLILFKLPVQPFKPTHFQPLIGSQITMHDKSPSFSVKVGSETNVYLASSVVEAKEWAKQIEEVAKQNKISRDTEAVMKAVNDGR